MEETSQENTEQTYLESKEENSEQQKADPQSAKDPEIQPAVQGSVETAEEGSPNEMNDDKLTFTPESKGHDSEQGKDSKKEPSPDDENKGNGIEAEPRRRPRSSACQLI